VCRLRDHSAEILDRLERHSSVPMSFADACLVRMSEIERDCLVFTTDRDFLTYKRNRRQSIPLISPF
jgi:predicted nucleic acid-binding protein